MRVSSVSHVATAVDPRILPITARARRLAISIEVVVLGLCLVAMSAACGQLAKSPAVTSPSVTPLPSVTSVPSTSSIPPVAETQPPVTMTSRPCAAVDATVLVEAARSWAVGAVGVGVELTSVGPPVCAGASAYVSIKCRYPDHPTSECQSFGAFFAKSGTEWKFITAGDLDCYPPADVAIRAICLDLEGRIGS